MLLLLEIVEFTVSVASPIVTLTCSELKLKMYFGHTFGFCFSGIVKKTPQLCLMDDALRETACKKQAASTSIKRIVNLVRIESALSTIKSEMSDSITCFMCSAIHDPSYSIF